MITNVENIQHTHLKNIIFKNFKDPKMSTFTISLWIILFWKTWFQLDGVTAHFENETIHFLKNKLNVQVISKNYRVK